jgi:hypothetical protein
MGTRKELLELKNQIKNLQDFLCKDVETKMNELKDLKANISNISLRVKKISPILLENGEECIKIEYEAPSVILRFDSIGDPIYDPLFYSINMLDLIPGEDFKKISQHLHQVSKNKKSF